VSHFEHQNVTGALHIVPDNQYDTALTPWMKSHPGFHAGNFLHALALGGLMTPSSVLMLVHMDNYVRDKSGHIANMPTKKSAVDCGFRAASIAGLKQQARLAARLMLIE
jgi:hypothetical protein